MKITDSENINIIPNNNQQPGKTGNKAFEKILNEKMEGVSTSEPESKPSDRINRASAALLRSAMNKKNIISRVAEFLDTIEEYSEKLARTGNSLKDVSPLIAKIESETQHLKSFSDSLSQEDELKSLVEEALIRSSVEVIKFNRGDYLNS